MKTETLEKYRRGKELFDEGKTLTEIQKTLHLNRGLFSKWLKDNFNYETKYSKEEKYNKGKEMFLDGKSLTEISKVLHISRKRFSEWLKTQNIVIKNQKYSYDKSFFSKIDTEEKAYWLGFLYADGCVIETRSQSTNNIKSYCLELGLSSLDNSHLKKFLKSLKSNIPIKNKEVKLNNKTFSCSVVKISCSDICRDLISLGCVPRKSLILTFPTKEQVPNYLIKHFIRGYIDGDGSVFLSTNKKFLRLEILGTENFLNGCIQTMNWKNLKKQKSGQAYSIQYYGEYVFNYLKEIYEDSTIYLERKYNIFKDFAVLRQEAQKSQNN